MNDSAAQSLSNFGAQRNDLAFAQGMIQVIGPVLHHPGARPQIESVIVGSTHGIPRSMGKLQFDVLMCISLLMQIVDASPQKPWPVIRPL